MTGVRLPAKPSLFLFPYCPWQGVEDTPSPREHRTSGKEDESPTRPLARGRTHIKTDPSTASPTNRGSGEDGGELSPASASEGSVSPRTSPEVLTPRLAKGMSRELDRSPWSLLPPRPPPLTLGLWVFHVTDETTRA